MPSFLLVPSPLLGPATWHPTAQVLVTRGHRVRVAAVDDVASDGRDDVVLVPHSNAGLHASYLGRRVGAVATVYVDAALPLGAGATTPLAPPAFLEFLAGLADDQGMLPPWTQWWDDLAGVFPDAETQAAVEAEQQRLPLSWFSRRVPVDPGWAERPSAYLGFGETYADEVAFARRQGWPLTVLAGGHLHQLHDPDRVATEILALVGRLR